MSTFDRPAFLERTLKSIFDQKLPESTEIIVVDDGSPTRETWEMLGRYPIIRHRIDREPSYRNPSTARNVAYRAARGSIIIAQSDDVMHTPGAVAGLIEELRPGTFVIATVYNVDDHMRRKNQPLYCFTGPECRRPFFFLGSLYRKDLYAIGGNDEGYKFPGYDDNAFADSLIRGLGLKVNYTEKVIGYHQAHIHRSTPRLVAPSKQRYQNRYKRMKAGKLSWLSPGAPWKYIL